MSDLLGSSGFPYFALLVALAIGSAVLGSSRRSPFEHFVAHLFRSKGNQATVVGRGGDHGVDVVVENPTGQRAIVQCKRWSGKWVDESVVRDLHGAMMHDGPNTHGYLVTTSQISEAARVWASGKPITLIDGERLARALLELRQAEKAG